MQIIIKLTKRHAIGNIRKIVSKSFGLRVKNLLGVETLPVILPYRGYGTPEKIWLRGHVLDDRVLYEATLHDRKRRNMKAMLSRYMSDALPGVRVEIDFGGQKQMVKTDENGLFQAVFEFSPSLSGAGWVKAHYTVLDQLVEGQEKMTSHADVHIVSEHCEYGIISDVDDTILVSHATALFKKMRLILTKNAVTRLPFPGIAAFYKSLQEGVNIEVENPIFYVSSSEWNLYDFLLDFCKYRDIPKGAFLLQDYKENLLELIKSGGGTHDHKLHKIRHLLDAFPKIKFILIGDSGQRDPEIYSQIVHEYEGRILAIYIRDVSKEKKDFQVKKISETLRSRKVDMLLVPDTLAAARHALEKGFITSAGLEQVEADFKTG